MFCIYESRSGEWQSELVMYGNVKLTAKGKTPIESLTKLFEMIGEENEPGVSAEVDGSISGNESCAVLPPNCS